MGRSHGQLPRVTWDGEVEAGARFKFGANWADFLKYLSAERIEAAEASLKAMLALDRLDGKAFLDIGSGSGLFSLAARRLGARVTSFDYDAHSVACTRELKLRFFADDPEWEILQGSILDEAFVTALGTFDVVYSWGVLHHTGDLWRAVEAASRKVAPLGLFAFALYEKTPLCGAWRLEKQAYVRAGPGAQAVIRSVYKHAHRAARLASGRGAQDEILTRGMSVDHDVHDWLGGYPYESTTSSEVRNHMVALGFEPMLERPAKVHLAGLFGTGCSEYVYRRSSVKADSPTPS